MSKPSFFQEERLRPDRPLRLRDGGTIDAPVFLRRSKLYPGHLSLVAPLPAARALAPSARGTAEEVVDPETCPFCRPTLLKEAREERLTLQVGEGRYIAARTPFYYLPGHTILFPEQAPHSLGASREEDWFPLLLAGVRHARSREGMRFGFNAGTYLCCGGSRRHLHIQLVPLGFPAPSEEALLRALPAGAAYDEILEAYRSGGLVAEEETSSCRAFLAACFAPRFDLEMAAFFERPRRFADLGREETACLARWIHGVAQRFVVPAGGGLNGYGIETGTLPFMVRLIPRLPGAVQAFMEAGAGCMVIRRPPEEAARSFRPPR